MGPIASILRVMTHPFTHAGRAGLSEYWWFAGLSYLGYALHLLWWTFGDPADGGRAALDDGGLAFWTWLEAKTSTPALLGELEEDTATVPGLVGTLIYGIFSLWHYLAWCAVGARRLHDTGRGAGLYLLIHLWSYVLGIVLILLGYLVTADNVDNVGALAVVLPMIALISIPLSIIFLVASIWYFFCMFFPGDPGRNTFGPKGGPVGERAPDRAQAGASAPGAGAGSAISADDLRALRASRMGQ